MDIRQLRYFVAVAEELHFGRAAARLRIAQPALTRQIQQLEADLDAQLLARSSRRAELLPAGVLLLNRARAILAAVRQAEADTKRLSRGETGSLMIGFVHSSTYTLLPMLLAQFRTGSSDVEVKLREMRSPDQVSAIQLGEIDVGLIRPVPIPLEVATRVAFEERFVIAIPSKHPLAKRSKIRLAELSSERFVSFSELESVMFHSAALAMCGTAGFRPKVAQEATHVHTVIGLVGSGFGIAIVPEIARSLSNKAVVFAEISDRPPPIQMLLAWSSSMASPTALRFVQLVDSLGSVS